MNVFNKSILILIVLLFTSCEQKSVTIDFNENINIGFMETFNDQGKKEFLLFCGPEQNCYCMEAELLYRYFRFGSNIECNLLEIQIPKGCHDNYGKASASIMLGSLPNGKYNIRINTKENSNTAILNITDTAYCVKIDRNDNINLIWGHYRRVFNNTLWGAFSYNTENELNKGLSLIDTLTALGAQPTTLEDGDYSFFSIENGKPIKSLVQIVPHSYSGKEIAFVFDYNFDDEKLKILLTKYIHTSGDLYIMVRSGKGFSFYNWR